MKMSKALIKIVLMAILTAVIYFGQTLIVPQQAFSMGSGQMPTAIVMDADTGEPIEGAVAIAFWRKDLGNYTWFEGGRREPVRIEEVISDKEGNIYIDDFWDWHLQKGSYPRLTVYKFGYVCWDQKKLFEEKDGSKFRTDFNKEQRVDFAEPTGP